jgi:glycerol-3-phosphate dehydrogenase
VYVGLTDEPADGPVPDVPEPTEAEIGFLLDVLGSVLDLPVRRDEVAGAYAGLRPLLDDGEGATADISRRHRVLTSPDGVITIVGGKLTTYRRMAQDAVDEAVRALPEATGRRSRTARIPLVGAAPPPRLAPLDAPQRLVRRYGTEAPLLTTLARERGDGLAPVTPGSPVLGVELDWAVRHEGALDVGDLLDRRTRIGLVKADRDAAIPAAEGALRREGKRSGVAGT